MQYMMLVYLNEDGNPNEEQRRQCYEDSAAFCRKLATEGKYILSAPLHPTSTATSVRTVEGKRLITDGPFAETREQLGGFFLVNAADLDEAIEMAKQVPAGRWGTVEIRPVVEVSGLPEKSAVDLTGARSTYQ